MKLWRSVLAVIALATLCNVGLVKQAHASQSTYFSVSDLMSDVFGSTQPSTGALWLTPERKTNAEQLLGYTLDKARVRFWYQGDTRLWVLSEIGKEKPITFGIVTQKGIIQRIEVMVFRESRGDEIRLPQYTAQYKGNSLTSDGNLSRDVDGISGATYSVRSMKKVAKLALLFDTWS
ncbi:MAG: FMN-binding protein [Oleibacter sp.]|nr:FMN-binding protein [Thalassolituus sp.]